jgi:uncharacterized protein DUF6968
MRDVTVSSEGPRQRPRGHWECRFLIRGLGTTQVRRVEGEDSLQALLLAIEGARVTLDVTGRFTWLETDPEKAGSGVPRYVPTHQGPRFEARINLAIERESKRYYQRILNGRKADLAALEAEVEQRRELLGILENRLRSREAGGSSQMAS